MIRLILTLLVIHAASTAARLFPSTNDYAPLYTPAELKQNDLRRAQGLAPIKPFAAIAHGLQNFVPPVAMSDVKRMKRRRVGQDAVEVDRVPQCALPPFSLAMLLLIPVSTILCYDEKSYWRHFCSS